MLDILFPKLHKEGYRFVAIAAIITFVLMVLFSAFGAVFGMMYFNRIPRFHHPVFYSDKFSRVTSDAFYVSIEISDPKYNEKEVKSFLKT